MKKRKLNNKGMTAIEILICFVLVVVITTSLFSMVSAYKNKQQIESFKQQIFTYKNLLAKEINDDLIKNGLIDVKIIENINTTEGVKYTVDLYLKNGKIKTLNIQTVKGFYYFSDDNHADSIYPADKDHNDQFMIMYGDKGNETKYPIPDLGESENNNGKIIKDLRINDVSVEVIDGVFTAYIGFFHPDLGINYAIDIICPINY